MKKIILLGILCILLTARGLSQGVAPTTWTEADGSPRVSAPTKVIFGNGVLSCSGKICTISIGAGGGTVTSVATTGPISGGTITGAGTISCPTCVTSAAALTSNALVIGQGSQASAVTTTGTGVLTALGVNVGSAGAFVVLNGALGTPSSGTLTAATGLPISTGVSGLGTGVATALAVNTGSAGAFVLFNGAGGTPSTLALANATGLPPTTGIVGWPANAGGCLSNDGSGVLSWAACSGGGGSGTVTSIATTGPITGGTITTTGTIACATCVTSAAALTNNSLVIGGGLQATSTATTGTGVLTALGVNVGSAGAFVTFNGALGTPSSGTATNLSGTAASLTAGAATVLATARNINGTAFDGSANITVTAAAGTLTGTTLNSSVVTSSLTSVGTIATGTWQGSVIGATYGGAGTVSGILKANGSGTVSAATAGTDYASAGAVTGSGLTMATARLLGRSTASTGAIEEITVGSGLSLSGGTLSASGGGGSPAGSTGDYQINGGGGSFAAGVLVQGSNARLIATPTLTSSGVVPYLRVITPADTAQTADTEFPGIVFGGNSSSATVTRQAADGTTLATQREYLFVAPTYTAVGATTITNASTVAISAAPTCNTNMTCTNRYGLHVTGNSITVGTQYATGYHFDTAGFGRGVGFDIVDDLTFTWSLNSSIRGYFAGDNLQLRTNGGILGFGSTIDTGLARPSAGRLEVNSGTAAAYRDIIVRQYFADQTITAGGSTGNQTINKSAGTVNVASSGSPTSVTVTNSLVTTSSTIYTMARTNDTTCSVKNVVPASGSFVINLTAACTAETSFGFLVVN